MTGKKTSLIRRPSSEPAREDAPPVKDQEEHPYAKMWTELMIRVRRELLKKNTPKRQRALLEMRAKLVIMGPDFLGASEDRIRAMFDCEF